MTKFILNKLNISKNIITVLLICDDYKSAVNFLHEYIENNYDKKDIVTYVKDNNRIFQFQKSLGYIYDTKNLEYVYQICSFTE